MDSVLLMGLWFAACLFFVLRDERREMKPFREWVKSRSEPAAGSVSSKRSGDIDGSGRG